MNKLKKRIKNIDADIKAVIFDLDGVLVDTAIYHYQAWRSLAQDLGFDFSEEQNEELKGVSRVESLNKILKWGNKEVSAAEFEALATTKNKRYLTFIDQMKQDEILPGTATFLEELQQQQILIALGSASKNARLILEKTKITAYFNAIIDGNLVKRSKPDPEVFLKAAAELQVAPESCLVFEDAQAGVEAARAAGMHVIGVVGKSTLVNCDAYVKDLSEMCK